MAVQTSRRPRSRALFVAIVLGAVTGALVFGGTASRVPWGWDAVPAPVVRLSLPLRPAENVTMVSVDAAEPELPLATFRATLRFDGTLRGRIETLVHGARSGALSFSEGMEDVFFPDGRLSQSDRFIVSPTPVGDYGLLIEWHGRAVAEGTWREDPSERPFVTLAVQDSGPNGTVARVADVNLPTPLEEFSARLLRNDTFAGEMAPLFDGVSGGLRFVDAPGPGTGFLSAGDWFASSEGFPGLYDLFVIWKSTTVASVEWQAGAVEIPLVALSGPTGGSYTIPIGVDVLSVSRAAPLGEFAAYLYQNGTEVGALNPLFPGEDRYVSFLDVGGSGSLSAGDQFDFGCSEQENATSGCPTLPRGFAYVFLLHWFGFEVGRVSFTY